MKMWPVRPCLFDGEESRQDLVREDGQSPVGADASLGHFQGSRGHVDVFGYGQGVGILVEAVVELKIEALVFGGGLLRLGDGVWVGGVERGGRRGRD